MNTRAHKIHSPLKHYEGEDVAIVEEWLKEARRTHDMFLGEGHFNSKFPNLSEKLRSEENTYVGFS